MGHTKMFWYAFFHGGIISSPFFEVEPMRLTKWTNPPGDATLEKASSEKSEEAFFLLLRIEVVDSAGLLNRKGASCCVRLAPSPLRANCCYQ